ncbi:MAG TPA: glycosyltransferase [Ktedonobacteraceae bacterium]|nr:glycosyltransferase [Ktedonobacteraceae bacterium]
MMKIAFLKGFAMRVLFVTPYVPSRIRVRPFNLIKSLSSVHEISLVSLLCDEYEREMVQDVANYCASVDLVPLSKSQAYKNCLLALPTLTPLRVAYYQSPAFIARIKQVIHERHIEVVHGELIKVAPALRAMLAQENIPLLYDSVDCISWYLQQQYASARNPLKRAFIYSELQKMRRYERQSLAAFDQVIITSSHDRDCLIALGEEPSHVKVVPNGVDIEYFTPPVAPREKDSLVFCAKLDYYPNSQAILHFCREILPQIWAKRPQVRLTIAGNNPPQAVRDLSSDERITVTGYVPDIRPYLGSASVALAPLRVAAGMQNKVLEALAMGAPVVATPGSCRSLQVKHETHLLIADEPQSYAEAVLRLLEDPQLAQDLGNAGRYYVEQYHSWVAASNMLSNLYSMISTTRDQGEHLSQPAYT